MQDGLTVKKVDSFTEALREDSSLCNVEETDGTIQNLEHGRFSQSTYLATTPSRDVVDNSITRTAGDETIDENGQECNAAKAQPPSPMSAEVECNEEYSVSASHSFLADPRGGTQADDTFPYSASKSGLLGNSVAVKEGVTDVPLTNVNDANANANATNSPSSPENVSLASTGKSTLECSRDYREKRRGARALRLKEQNITIGAAEPSKMTAVHVTPNTSHESRVSTPSDARLESSHGSQDIEDGVATNPSRNSPLVVAFVVGEQGDDDDDMQQKTLVHAVRFDPDIHSSSGHNLSLRSYAIIAALLVLVLIVALTIAFLAPQQKSYESVVAAPTPTSLFTPSPTSGRAIEYRNYFAQFVGDNVHNLETPLYSAADWIINQDKLQRGLDHPYLLQRYMMAFLYYQTTDNRNAQWKSCNPPLAKEDDTCDFLLVTSLEDNSAAYVPQKSIRWLSSHDECSWAGIVCDERSEIMVLSLGAQDLTGSLPSEIAVLSSLQILSLLGNTLTGNIPAAYANLLALEVHGNLLTGSIPRDFFETDTKVMGVLNVGNNSLSGRLDSRIGLMTNLRGLHLFENNFSGSFPTEVGNLLSLSYMRVNGNQFTGPLPSELGRLDQLVEFWFQDNQFNGTISSEFGQLSQLENFRLAGNMMTGTIPDEIFNMSRLQFLDLKEMRLTGTLSSLVGQLTELLELEVSANQLTGTIPSAIQNLSSLRTAWLHFNLFVGQVPTEICSLRLEFFQADCSPLDNPPNACSCCSACCNRDQRVCLSTHSDSR